MPPSEPVRQTLFLGQYRHFLTFRFAYKASDIYRVRPLRHIPNGRHSHGIRRALDDRLVRHLDPLPGLAQVDWVRDVDAVDAALHLGRVTVRNVTARHAIGRLDRLEPSHLAFVEPVGRPFLGHFGPVGMRPHPQHKQQRGDRHCENDQQAGEGSGIDSVFHAISPTHLFMAGSPIWVRSSAASPRLQRASF